MKCYVVDAFTDRVFQGNPAAVCVLIFKNRREILYRRPVIAL